MDRVSIDDKKFIDLGPFSRTGNIEHSLNVFSCKNLTNFHNMRIEKAKRCQKKNNRKITLLSALALIIPESTSELRTMMMMIHYNEERENKTVDCKSGNENVG